MKTLTKILATVAAAAGIGAIVSAITKKNDSNDDDCFTTEVELDDDSDSDDEAE